MSYSLARSRRMSLLTRMYEPSDLYRFIESLKYRPETYRTILLERYNNKGTETAKIRRKISGFVKHGLIASGLLDGESGTKIFYSLEKKYLIFIVKVDCKYFYYYCSDVDEYCSQEGCLVMYNAFILEESDWNYLGNISVRRDTISRWW